MTYKYRLTLPPVLSSKVNEQQLSEEGADWGNDIAASCKKWLHSGTASSYPDENNYTISYSKTVITTH